MFFKVEIEGMSCEHCVRAVVNALSGLGATNVNIQIGSAQFEYVGEQTGFKEAIEEAGFAVKAVFAE